jgi:hypothetical protein
LCPPIFRRGRATLAETRSLDGASGQGNRRVGELLRLSGSANERRRRFCRVLGGRHGPDAVVVIMMGINDLQPLDLAGLSELFREPRVAATTKPGRTTMGVDLMGLGGCIFNWRAGKRCTTSVWRSAGGQPEPSR